MKAFFGKIKDWFVRHKPTKRRLIQVYAALLYNANIKGFVSGSIYTGNSKYMCVPGLNCYSCPGAVGACPLGALQNALAASNTKAPFYVFGIIILFGLLLGRTICGFLCPIGLLQDLLYKIKSPKLKKNKVTRVLSYLKYVILAVMVIMIPLAYAGISSAVPAFCKYICPSGTLLGSVSLLANSNNGEDFFSMLGPLFTWKFCVLVLIIVGSIFIYRMFCRFLCPLGAIYSFFCRVAMLGVKLDKQKCVDCGLCIQTCKMDIKHVGDHECIHCGDCLKVCPTKAITWKGSKIFLHPNAIEEGGESAAGEKVALSSLIASGTGNGGTIGINAGGYAAAGVGGNLQAQAHEDVQEAEVVTDEKENQEAQQPVYRTPENLDCYKIYYVFRSRKGWLVKQAGGATKLFNKRANALKYVDYSAGGNPALVYVQRAGGSFALTIHKALRVQEPVQAETVLQEMQAEDKDSVQLSLFDGEIPQPEEEEKTVEVPFGGIGKPLTKGEMKTAKRVYHGTLAYQKKRNKILEICAWALALVVLAAALLYYNVIAEEAVAEVSYEVGDTVSPFTMKKYFGGDDDTYNLQDDLDDGRIVILNFWYIGCQPCQEELPEFGEVAAEYSDEVSLVVIHSSTVSTGSLDLLESYVSDEKFMGWDFWAYDNVSFTLDNSDDQSIYTAMQGTNAYPMTVILNGDGVITARYASKIDKETLVSEIEAILNG